MSGLSNIAINIIPCITSIDLLPLGGVESLEMMSKTVYTGLYYLYDAVKYK
jgi:hypothetical protein